MKPFKDFKKIELFPFSSRNQFDDVFPIFYGTQIKGGFETHLFEYQI